MKQVEEMRHRAQIDTGTKMHAPDPKNKCHEHASRNQTKSLFKMLLSSEDDEMLNTMRTLQVNITEDSTIATRET